MRILRAVAGGALLLLLCPRALADYYVPREAGLWKPQLSADMAGPDVPTMFATDLTTPIFETYFANLEPLLSKLDPRERVSEPPPPGDLRPETRFVWIYQRGKFTLAVGPAGAGQDSALTQLLKQADEPTAFIVMGTGLILAVVAPRYHRRRARRQRMRATPKNSRPAARTGVRLIFRQG